MNQFCTKHKNKFCFNSVMNVTENLISVDMNNISAPSFTHLSMLKVLRRTFEINLS